MAKLKVYDRLQDLVDVTLLDVPGLQVLYWDFSTEEIKTASLYKTITFTFDGGADVLAGPAPAVYVAEQAMTIVGWTLLAKESGSLTLTVKKATYTDFPSMTSITGANNPALSSAQKNTDSTLTSWTTSVAAGDAIEVDISGTPATIKKAALYLKLRLN